MMQSSSSINSSESTNQPNGTPTSHSKSDISLSKLIVIFSITLMTAVGTSAIPPALSVVERVFSIGPDVSGRLLAVFTLPGIFLLPILGVLADRYGRKTILVPSLLLFALGGGIASFADSFNDLLLARFIQGIGWACLGALNVTLIGDYVTKQKQVTVMGYNNSVLSVGTALIPLISSQLAGANWHYPFMLPLLSIIVCIGVIVLLHEPTNTSSVKVPNEHTAFKQTLQIIRKPEIAILLFVSMLTFALLFGPFLNYLQTVVRQLYSIHEPTLANDVVIKRIGMIVSTMSIVTALTAFFLGRLAKRYTQKKLLIVSASLYSLSMIAFAYCAYASVSFSALFFPVILFGIAQALNQPNVQALLAVTSSVNERATVMSANRTISLIGQTTGPLMFGAIYGLTQSVTIVYVFGAVVGLILLITLVRFLHTTSVSE
jgi:MFS transporter, ACDE family, multidrug resistance protein